MGQAAWGCVELVHVGVGRGGSPALASTSSDLVVEKWAWRMRADVHLVVVDESCSVQVCGRGQSRLDD